MASWSSIAWASGGSLAAILALSLSGCSAQAALPSFGVVPDFHLTDQNSAPFSSSVLLGKVWIADFIFTNCAGPCPRMSAQMRQVDSKLADPQTFRFVSFSVDPARDTPPVLAKYAERYQAEPGVWFFLTGSQTELQRMSRTVFMLGDVDGSLQHSTRFVLIDKKGRIRGYYLTSEEDALPRLISDARRLAKETF